MHICINYIYIYLSFIYFIELNKLSIKLNYIDIIIIILYALGKKMYINQFCNSVQIFLLIIYLSNFLIKPKVLIWKFFQIFYINSYL